MNRWYSINDFRRLQNTIGPVRPQFRNFPGVAAEGATVRAWTVPVDVTANDEETVIRASLPGVDPDNIHVSVEDRILTIKGQTSEGLRESDGPFLVQERRTGSFHRALQLPDFLDLDKLQPHYEHGVLTITLPKSEAKRAREFPVLAGSGPVSNGS